MEDVFVKVWELYNKQVSDSLITQILQKYSTEKLSPAATEDAQK